MTEEEIMLTSILECSRSDLYTKGCQLSLPQVQELNTMRERREAGEPLQYILGEWSFCGLNFNVNEHVLIPRPETEILIESVLHHMKINASHKIQLLDLGTGSGNIAISLAKFIENCQVTAIDKCEESISTADKNAEKNDVKNKIIFVCQEMEEYLKLCKREKKVFDIIISNPPYISKKGMEHLPLDVQKEPYHALYGGEDGLDYYRFIIKNYIPHINENGMLALEIGDGQKDAIRKIMENTDSVESFQFIRDYIGEHRICIAHIHRNRVKEPHLQPCGEYQYG